VPPSLLGANPADERGLSEAESTLGFGGIATRHTPSAHARPRAAVQGGCSSHHVCGLERLGPDHHPEPVWRVDGPPNPV